MRKDKLKLMDAEDLLRELEKRDRLNEYTAPITDLDKRNAFSNLRKMQRRSSWYNLLIIFLSGVLLGYICGILK